MHVQSCCFCQSILNLLFSAVLVDVAVVFAQAPYCLIRGINHHVYVNMYHVTKFPLYLYFAVH